MRNALELDDETKHDTTDNEAHNGESEGDLPPHLVAPHRNDHCHEAGREEEGDVDEKSKPKHITYDFASSIMCWRQRKFSDASFAMLLEKRHLSMDETSRHRDSLYQPWGNLDRGKCDDVSDHKN